MGKYDIVDIKKSKLNVKDRFELAKQVNNLSGVLSFVGCFCYCHQRPNSAQAVPLYLQVVDCCWGLLLVLVLIVAAVNSLHF